MPRHARIDSPGLLHHVIARGVNRSKIFLDDLDREDFTHRLETLLAETKTICYAWAMLDNHFHLLVMPTDTTLATFMRRLLTGYAVSFNLRHKRTGHLFQNRYKSIVCDGDSYLLELIRYIHLNPVRARKLKGLDELETYPWSGHRQLLGKVGGKLLRESEILSLFSRQKEAARRAYLQFLADGLEQDAPPRLSQGGRRISQSFDQKLNKEDEFDDRILGGGDFVRQVLGERPAESSNLSLDHLIASIADHYKLSPQELSWPSKERVIVRAKAVICYIAIRHHRYPGVEVAKRLGFSTSAASHATKRGRQIIDKNEGARLLFEGIMK